MKFKEFLKAQPIAEAVRTERAVRTVRLQGSTPSKPSEAYVKNAVKDIGKILKWDWEGGSGEPFFLFIDVETSMSDAEITKKVKALRIK